MAEDKFFRQPDPNVFMTVKCENRQDTVKQESRLVMLVMS